MEWIEGFLGGFALGLFSWPGAILAVCFILGIIADHNDSQGVAAFFTVVSAIAAYFLFDVSASTIAIVGIGFLVVGFAYSIYRYWRWVREQMILLEEDSYYNENAQKRKIYIDKLHFKNQLSRITGWIISWPVSLIANIAGDLIDGIKLMITNVFRGVFQSIFDSATNLHK